MVIRRLSFEALESRQMMAVFSVSSLSDAVVTGGGQAPGTLRQAIFDANATPGVADEIVFSSGLSGTIQLTNVGGQIEGPSALVVTSPITIRGNANGITIARGASAPEMRLFHVTASGNLTLESINLTGGLARGEAGLPGGNGGDGRGGAVFNAGSLQIVASTLHNNVAIGGAPGAGGVTGQGLGGAIYNADATLAIRNATFSGNQALNSSETTASAAFGGAIYGMNGNVAIYNSTITENAAVSGQGVYCIAVGEAANVTVHSSIIAQSDDLIFDFFAAADGGGTITVDGANNLIHRLNDFVGIAIPEFTWPDPGDPRLAPLTNNGGPTLTHALQEDSPAKDRGANPLNLTTDQRGSTFARELGDWIDVGAFEAAVFPPVLAGDYNRDTAVDAADYVVWRKFLGGDVAPYALADGDGSGEIDALDHDVWTERFGTAAPLGAPGVAVVVDAAASESGSRPRKIVPREGWIADDDARDEALLSLLTGWDGVARGGASRLDWGG